MNQYTFDALTRSLTGLPSRRAVLRVLASGGLVLAVAQLPTAAVAGKAHNRPRSKSKLNAFVCLSVGRSCKNDGQCCSGICDGTKGKRRCRGHDGGGCSGDLAHSGGGGMFVSCTASTGDQGFCQATTGHAGYCSGVGNINCATCSRDADCPTAFGPHAACIQIPGECEAGTACAGLDALVM